MKRTMGVLAVLLALSAPLAAAPSSKDPLPREPKRSFRLFILHAVQSLGDALLPPRP